MSPTDVDTAYRELVVQTHKLDTAFDTSFQFAMQGQAAFTGCGPGACRVTATLNTSFIGRNATPRSTADADMVVTMLGDGAPAGGCTARGTLPVNGTGQMSCINVSSAWSAYYARAATTPGTHVHVANVVVTARVMTEVLIAELIRKLQEENQRYLEEQEQRGNPPSARPSRSKQCQPKDPVYGPLDNGRATSAHAILCDPLKDGSPAPQIALRGLPMPMTMRPDNTFEFGRAHLIAKRMGGEGVLANLVPLYSKVNGSTMIRCENRVVNAVVDGKEQVEITVRANYVPGKLIPESVSMTAVGDGGFRLNVTIPNVDSAVNIDACNR
jgi:hypothetical protein